eukprot:Opistho-2@44258
MAGNGCAGALILASVLAIGLLCVNVCDGAAHGRTRRLDDSIAHFEPLTLDVAHISEAHTRHRRSGGVQPMTVDFQAFDRKFTLHLVSNRIHFEDAEFEAVYADGIPRRIDLDKTHFLRGIVQGDRASEVIVSVFDGRLEGIVNAHGESFRIESSHRYFREAHDFNAVMYRASDVDVSPLARAGCLGGAQPPPVVGEEHVRSLNMDETVYSMFNPGYLPSAARTRRAFNPAKSTCLVYLIAEHSFTADTVAQMANGGVGFSDLQKQAEVIRRITSYLAAADSIYRQANFAGDSGYGLGVGKVTVYFNNTGTVYTETPVSDDYLRYFAQSSNFDAYCLAHIFSYREFNDGVLGLAYLSFTDRTGGICAKFSPVRLSTGDAMMSLNTGLVTTLNFGRRVSTVVTEITFAHEAGHNHGSKHDNDASVNCVNPSPDNGNFIMFAQATDGSKTNNRLFSECSRSSMAANINAKAATCFKPTTAACGDLIVTASEACDCGGDAALCASVDPCCTANCTLSSGSDCSPLKTVCCDSTCKFRSSSVVCKAESDCAAAVTCNAANKNGCGPINATVDTSFNSFGCNCREANNKDCPLVCDAGQCKKSFCATLTPPTSACQCLSPENRQCTLCCMINGTCTSTFDMPSPKNITLTSTYGCLNNLGWCDSRNAATGAIPQCKLINNPDTTNLFSSDTLNAVLSWLKKNWYYVLAGVGGAVVLVILLKVTYRKKDVGDQGSFGQRVRNSFRRNPGPSKAAPVAAIVVAGGAASYTATNPDKYKESMSMEPVQYVTGPSDVDARRDACRELKRMYPTVDDTIIVSTLKSFQFDVRRAAMQLNEMGYKPAQAGAAPRTDYY